MDDTYADVDDDLDAPTGLNQDEDEGDGPRDEGGERTGLPLQSISGFRIMWPEVIFVSLLLREHLGSRYDLEYSKQLKGLDWTLDWVAVRRFQIVILDCLYLHVSPGQAKSIRKIFLESYSHMSGYCTQYVDKLTNTFARKNAEQRLKLLPLLPRRIMVQGNDYRSLEAGIRKTAREYGCPPWELSLIQCSQGRQYRLPSSSRSMKR